VSGSLTCLRSLKSRISSLNIGTGFLGFFSEIFATLRNMIINFLCTPTEFGELWILKGGFRSIKTRGVNICLPRSDPILCIILSQNLQAYTKEQGDLEYRKLRRAVVNFALRPMYSVFSCVDE